MGNSNQWKPEEIIVNKKIQNDPVTKYILKKCKGVPIRKVDNAISNTIVNASKILSGVKKTNLSNKTLPMVLAGKKVLYLGPAGSGVVDTFNMADDRMMCPHFDRLKFASNGCFYKCDWCYLKGTYRANQPYISINTEYDKIKRRIIRRLDSNPEKAIFNSGEMADSLALEHLTRAGRTFIPFFGRTENGYLFMLTKSDNVDNILDLDHNGHTIIAWSMNNSAVSRKYEIGAPSFRKRLEAARKVQEAGYPLRVRLDPIVPFDGWKSAYSKTITKIFRDLSPERITLGTLRFEKAFYSQRKTIFNTGPELPEMVGKMKPMFEPKVFPGSENSKTGKHSFSENKRKKIFRFAIDKIRKYSDCKIALCKESEAVWRDLGLNLSKCSCICQLDYAEMPPQE